MNTHDRIAKFISSQQMESSETQKRIIDLGTALVEELGLNRDVDTFSRWMAHYVAQQITIAENATGDEKRDAEQRCFEVILKLWYHRSSLPNGRRPFESFEPILRALERLDPENTSPYFYPRPESRSPESADSDEDADEVQQWLRIAATIDQAARICLEYAFLQAAAKAKDERTTEFLELAADIEKGQEISIILQLLGSASESESEEAAQRKQEEKQEKIRTKIKQLAAFIDLSQHLRAAIATELEMTAPSDSPTQTDKARP